MNIPSGDHRLDHVAVAVHSIEETGRLIELLTGETCSRPETLIAQGVRVAFVGSTELLEPLGPETTVGRFLERRGPALHHIAYRTDDIESELGRLEAAGIRLIDRSPRSGARGHSVAFLHPDSTGGVLIELVQHAGPESTSLPTT
jgi:methylmalonyl-CoA/ethylmalonyl-CoA epimerase